MEALLQERAFITTADAAATLGRTPAEAAALVEAAAAHQSGDGAQALYAVVRRSAVDGDQHVTLYCGRNEAEKARESAAGTAQVHVFAAVLPGCRAAAALSGKRPALTSFLRPKMGAAQRAYPLVTREALEQEAETGLATKPNVAPPEPPTPKPVAVAVKTEAEPAKAAAPQPTQREESLIAQAETPVQSSASCSTHHEITAQPLAPTPIPATTATASAESQPSPVEKKQASLFDMMKTASANAARQAAPASGSGQKRPRAEKSRGDGAQPTAAEAESKQKKTRKPKAPKTETTAPSKSLAKLAKASAKNRKGQDGAPPRTHVPMHGLLDDDEDAEEDSASTSHASAGRDDSVLGNSCMPAEAHASAEASVLDVTETITNDDIIICDDAPPLAFLTPASVAPVASAQHSSPTGAAASSPNGRSAASGAQSTLGAFFNPEVVKFQKSYVRKLRTEMEKDANGEYNCVDVPYYEPVSGAGECLSEEAYYRRAAEIARTARADGDAVGDTPARRCDAGEGAKAEESPEAADVRPTGASATGGKHGVRPLVSKVAPAPKTEPRPKTLMAFFKPKS